MGGGGLPCCHGEHSPAVGLGVFWVARLMLPCGWMTCLTLPPRTTRRTPPRHSRAGGNPGASTACSRCVLSPPSRHAKAPTAHAVARSGFPPARERQVGETHCQKRLASDGFSGLIYFKTKSYLATANHPPRPTPRHSRAGGNPEVSTTRSRCVRSPPSRHAKASHGARCGTVWVPACAGTTSG